jgi:hypothetical protein
LYFVRLWMMGCLDSSNVREVLGRSCRGAALLETQRIHWRGASCLKTLCAANDDGRMRDIIKLVCRCEGRLRMMRDATFASFSIDRILIS